MRYLNTFLQVILFALLWPLLISGKDAHWASEILWLLIVLGAPTVAYKWNHRHELKLAWIQDRHRRADHRYQEKVRRAQEVIHQAKERQRNFRE